jgi:SAM-dependent methyltransferase
VEESKQSVAGLFGRVAAGYDEVGFFHQVAGRLLALAGVGQGMRILDVACGAGAVLVPAARLVGPAGLAVGVDLAAPMAAVAAGKLRRLDQGRGAAAVMNAERLGLRASWFDVVCCASAIYLLDDQAAAVRSWSRLLRPDGRLAISEFGDLDARWAWKDELLACSGHAGLAAGARADPADQPAVPRRGELPAGRGPGGRLPGGTGPRLGPSPGAGGRPHGDPMGAGPPAGRRRPPRLGSDTVRLAGGWPYTLPAGWQQPGLAVGSADP